MIVEQSLSILFGMRVLVRFGAIAAVLASASLLGCGDDAGNGTLIGEPCTDSAMCDPAGVCITSGKGGACSLPCQVPGAAGECPLGSYCDREEVATNGSTKAEQTLCFPACDRDSDCRNGYKCKGVSSGHGKVCSPN